MAEIARLTRPLAQGHRVAADAGARRIPRSVRAVARRRRRSTHTMTQPDPETSIERLIKLAGERDMPSREGTERARLQSTSPGAACSRNARALRAIRAEDDAGVRDRCGSRCARGVFVAPASHPAGRRRSWRALRRSRAVLRCARTAAKSLRARHCRSIRAPRSRRAKAAWRLRSATHCRCASTAIRDCASTAATR